MKSESLKIAKSLLGKTVEVVMDRPMGSRHPKHDFEYPVNYGYIEGTKAPDGEELDAYYLGVSEPLSKATGTCVAIIHRHDDDDDKLVVTPNNIKLSKAEILKLVHFQEQWFKSELIQ